MNLQHTDDYQKADRCYTFNRGLNNTWRQNSIDDFGWVGCNHVHLAVKHVNQSRNALTEHYGDIITQEGVDIQGSK